MFLATGEGIWNYLRYGKANWARRVASDGTILTRLLFIKWVYSLVQFIFYFATIEFELIGK